MDRESWMYIKAAMPGIVLVALSMFVLWTMARLLGGSEMGAALFDTWRWAPAAGMGLGLLTLCWRLFRVQQALSGSGPTCDRCYGPLGGVIDGRYGPYRKCMCCGRNVAQQQ